MVNSMSALGLIENCKITGDFFIKRNIEIFFNAMKKYNRIYKS